MFNWFKTKTNIIRFTPCVNEGEISNFVVRDLLLEITNNNSLTLAFAGSLSLKDILDKLSYNLKKQNINYANINFVNPIDFDVVTKNSESLPFYEYMKKEFYSKLKIHDDHIYKINQKNNDITHKFLNKNIIDVLILEVGVDGHICFYNKKRKANFSVVNKVKLSESTRDEYAWLFSNNKTKVPLYGLSINLRYILNSKKIIIIANGATKATSSVKLLENKIDKTYLATYLTKNKNVTFYADLLALELVNK